MMKNKLIILSILLFIGIGFSSCEKYVDDTKNWGAVTGSQVYDNPDMMKLVINEWYGTLWGIQKDRQRNETPENQQGASNYLIGGVTNYSGRWDWPEDRAMDNRWKSLRSINDFLARIDDAPAELTDSERSAMKGQAYFFRAQIYFRMVEIFGGVPIIDVVQNVSGDPAELDLPRNTSLACFEFMEADLDLAIALLPMRGEGDYEADRIDKVGAMAWKVKALQMKAQPRFCNTKVDAYWQDAYNAAADFRAVADPAGFGLAEDNRQMWFDQDSRNTEFLVYSPRQYPIQTAGTSRPSSAGGYGPYYYLSWKMVEHYPMANGMDKDELGSGYDPEMWWANRDPRFYDNISAQGQLFETPDFPNNRTWYWKGSGVDANGGGLGNNKFSNPEWDRPTWQTESAWDRAWIRYTELLIWQAESANETGKPSEAFDNLVLLRERAGIEPGVDGRYGFNAGVGANYQETYDAILLASEIELLHENRYMWVVIDKGSFQLWRDWGSFDMNQPLFNADGFNALALEDEDGNVINVTEPIESGTYNIIRAALNTAMSKLATEDERNLMIRAVTDMKGQEPRDPRQAPDGDYPITIPDTYIWAPYWQPWINKSPASKQTIGWETGEYDPRITL
jgi:hypothetical protein